MSAEVPVYVVVEKIHREVVVIEAVTLREAEAEAAKLDGVIRVLCSSYDEITTKNEREE